MIALKLCLATLGSVVTWAHILYLVFSSYYVYFFCFGVVKFIQNIKYCLKMFVGSVGTWAQIIYNFKIKNIHGGLSGHQGTFVLFVIKKDCGGLIRHKGTN